MEGASRTRFSVYVSLVITCIGISLATNAVWVQMPVLEKTLAEVRVRSLALYPDFNHHFCAKMFSVWKCLEADHSNSRQTIVAEQASDPANSKACDQNLPKFYSQGKELPMYLLVLTEAGNVSVLLFIFFRKCCSNRLNEVPCLYICIGES